MKNYPKSNLLWKLWDFKTSDMPSNIFQRSRFSDIKLFFKAVTLLNDPIDWFSLCSMDWLNLKIDRSRPFGFESTPVVRFCLDILCVQNLIYFLFFMKTLKSISCNMLNLIQLLFYKLLFVQCSFSFIRGL